MPAKKRVPSVARSTSMNALSTHLGVSYAIRASGTTYEDPSRSAAAQSHSHSTSSCPGCVRAARRKASATSAVNLAVAHQKRPAVRPASPGRASERVRELLAVRRQEVHQAGGAAARTANEALGRGDEARCPQAIEDASRLDLHRVRFEARPLEEESLDLGATEITEAGQADNDVGLSVRPDAQDDLGSRRLRDFFERRWFRRKLSARFAVFPAWTPRSTVVRRPQQSNRCATRKQLMIGPLVRRPTSRRR